MAQFAVFFVQEVPPVGTTTHAVVYRGDHVDEAAAVAAAATALGLSNNTKVWAVPAGSLTAYHIDVVKTYDTVLG
jgi:asparagine synthetase B (glutamine-hydrolysing)